MELCVKILIFFKRISDFDRNFCRLSELKQYSFFIIFSKTKNCGREKKKWEETFPQNLDSMSWIPHITKIHKTNTIIKYVPNGV
jgi:hypothetical protein